MNTALPQQCDKALLRTLGIKTSITETTHKMGWIPSVSMMPDVSCRGQLPCRGTKSCNACRIARRPNVHNAWMRNYMIAINDRRRYFAEISQWITEHKPKYWRWHVGGDILDQNYLLSMIRQARKHPKVRFLCFTKQHQLTFGAMPKNMVVYFSMWPRWGDTRKNMPRAWLRNKHDIDPRIPWDAVECETSCDQCVACWHTKSKDIVFNKR